MPAFISLRELVNSDTRFDEMGVRNYTIFINLEYIEGLKTARVEKNRVSTK